MEPEDEVAVGLSGGQADATVARMLPGRQLRRFREAYRNAEPHGGSGIVTLSGRHDRAGHDGTDGNDAGVTKVARHLADRLPSLAP